MVDVRGLVAYQLTAGQWDTVQLGSQYPNMRPQRDHGSWARNVTDRWSLTSVQYMKYLPDAGF